MANRLEIVVGIILVALGLAIVAGLGAALGPLAGWPLAGALGVGGLTLIAHAAFRVRVGSPAGERRWLRTTGRMLWTCAIIALVAVVVPMLAPALNVATLRGAPLGFLMATEGCLLLLVLVAVGFAVRQDHIEREADARATA